MATCRDDIRSNSNGLPRPFSEDRQDKAYVQEYIEGLQCSKSLIPTFIGAAWAVLMGHYTASNEISFKRTPMTNGKISDLARTEDFYVIVPWDKPVEQFLKYLSDQGSDSTDSFDDIVTVPVQEHTMILHHPSKQNNDMLLKCCLQTNIVKLQLQLNSASSEEANGKRLLSQLKHVVQQLCAKENQEMPVAKISTVTEKDLYEMWERNAYVPSTNEKFSCIHGIVMDWAINQPDRPAICAWDGQLSYSQLEKYSTTLAKHLLTMGVCTGTIVPLCFEKSMWMPIAMLGVMKAGGACVAMDITQPEERLRTIVDEVKPALILSSATNKTLAATVSDCQVIVVDLNYVKSSPPPTDDHEIPMVGPQNTIYVSFTSSSTGKPKGAVINHGNVFAAVRFQGRSLGFTKSSRVFDLAPYCFDVAWSNVLHTLCAGGCLCVPSGINAMTGISASINSLDANLVNITPSLLRILDPNDVPSLETVLLSGEPPDHATCLRWIPRARLVNTYGPTECTFKSSHTDITLSTSWPPNIGAGIGSNLWVVNCHNADLLSCIGAIGELWLEGPLVGQGYLSDDRMTKKSFVKDPAWLLKGSPTYAGRPGLLYQTGDLVRSNSDGTVTFIGRKDTQVKIRGQRVELDEIEYHVRNCLAQQPEPRVVVEVVSPAQGYRQVLMAFIETNKMSASSQANIEAITGTLEETLTKALPSYMVPQVYVPLREIPLTPTGKTDRQRLRDMGLLILHDVSNATGLSMEAESHELTDTESRLVNLWKIVLGVDPDTIDVRDNFFRVGGGSISAIRLVEAASKEGISITVADVFRRPCLQELVVVAKLDSRETFAAISPLSLIKGSVDHDSLPTWLKTPCKSPPPFQRFVQRTLQTDSDAKLSFWNRELASSKARVFPQLPSPLYRPRADKTLDHAFHDIHWPTDGATASSIIRAAWSALIARHTNSEDVIFGVTVTGRQSAHPGIGELIAPTIATVPLRINVPWERTVKRFLEQVQRQAVDMIEYEQTGLQYIRRISAELERASQFQTLLVLQPNKKDYKKDENNRRALFEPDEQGAINRAIDDLSVFNSSALMLESQIESDGVRIQFSFDSSVIDKGQANRLSQQLVNTIRQICMENQVTTLLDIAKVSEQNLADIWNWNSSVPPTVDACVHEPVAEMATEYPKRPALSAWDDNLDYEQLHTYSIIAARNLVKLGVDPGIIVPLYLAKSVWTTVAMLAVMKTGAAFVLIPATDSSLRLHAIIAQCSSPFVVVSQDKGRGLDGCQGVILEDLLNYEFQSNDYYKPREAFQLRHTSRTFQFASYSFDVSILETFATLIMGGVVCVPSESERLNETARTILKRQANWLCINPSAAKALLPDVVPSLKTIVFAGEQLSHSDVARWNGNATVYNWYGPAEASLSACCRVYQGKWSNGTIGTAFANVCWVVDPENGNTLLPIGAEGELVVEGHAIAEGYLSQSRDSSSAFYNDPPWLLQGSKGHPGRRGRLYKTGDIVSYNADGTFKYRRRNDRQVKIYGQRVELEAVEHCLQEILAPDFVVETVVDIVTPAQSDDPILLAFLSFNSPNQFKENDSTLTMRNVATILEDRAPSLLPQHMNPSIYFPISKVPFTLNGKIDRRSLRVAAERLTLQQLTELLPAKEERLKPKTDVERALQQVWAKVLVVEPDTIVANDSFRRLGGDSIKTVIMSRLINQQFGIKLSVRDVLRQRALCDLAQEIARQQNTLPGPSLQETDLGDLVEDAKALSNSLQLYTPDTFEDTDEMPSRVFLTGATGYLGTAILYCLLQCPEIGQIFVLVPASSTEHAINRIIKSATISGWWHESYLSRIQPWLGDLEKSQFGLSDFRWNQLSGHYDSTKSIDGIVHNGAAVSWYSSYDDVRAANVISSQQLLQITATSPHLKRYVLISTAPQREVGCDAYSENSLRKFLADADGYGKSKLVAEQVMLWASSKQGFPRQRLAVVKPGFIIGNANSGVANVDDFLWRVVAGCVAIGSFPKASSEIFIHIATSDYVAMAATTCLHAKSDQKPIKRKVDDGLPVRDFWNAVNSALPIALDGKPFESWYAELETKVNENLNHPCLPVLHLIAHGNPFLGSEKHHSGTSCTMDRRLELEAATARNVKYLLEVGYFSWDWSSVNASVFQRQDKVR
ncbi:nonribosomal peptide synthase [Fusarium sporotrichioides]|uniref:Nonribosomal peptide synthase n=1 Tax=Fusarium sporotrichioides TaxID=5514 RepID=A0A395SBK7_FUSSP|nr:nonribosomal peptide synthase [Fusarium sporotrichioides]